MFRKTRITVLALTGAIAMTGAAEAAPKSKLTIKGPNGDFQGTIKAKKRSCMKDREVRVFMQTDQGPQEIGSDTSELNSEKTRGLWSTGNSGYKNGKFFARAAAKGQCAPLKSKTITVVTPDAEESDSTARMVGTGGDTPPRPVVTDTATAQEVDGAEGGYTREQCEKLLAQHEFQVEQVMAHIGHGNEKDADINLELAWVIHDEMTDNCLVVD